VEDCLKRIWRTQRENSFAGKNLKKARQCQDTEGFKRGRGTPRYPNRPRYKTVKVSQSYNLKIKIQVTGKKLGWGKVHNLVTWEFRTRKKIWGPPRVAINGGEYYLVRKYRPGGPKSCHVKDGQRA